MHYTLGFEMVKPKYRLFCSYWWKHVLNPMTYLKFVKHFCQRGYRGYADCDYWDAGSYLEVVIQGVLKDLKEKTHGYPCYLDGGLKTGEGDTKTLDKKSAGADKWNTILTEIIEGLDASRDLLHEDSVPEGVYSKEPIEWKQLENGMSEMVHRDDAFNKELYLEWRKPLEAKRLRAAKLMIKHWPSFWD